MTNDVGFDEIAPDGDMGDVLSRVRQLDPTSEESAVRSYVREMAEADAVLNTVDLGEAPLAVCFSAFWSKGDVR